MNSQHDIDPEMKIPDFSKTSINEQVQSVLNNPSGQKSPTSPKKNRGYALQATSNQVQETINSNPKSNASHYSP
jgi:hypothetical protein